MKKLRVAIYARKSRDNENMQDDTLFNQKKTLENYAKNKGYEYDIYEEVESSLLFERPQLSKMIQGIEEGKYKRLLITAIDRLARDVVMLHVIAKKCLEHGVLVETPDTLYDLRDANTKMMFGFQGVFAEAEMDKIRDRLSRGKYDAVALQGRHLTSVAPLGYIYDRNDKKLHVHEEQSKIIRKIVEMLLKGISTVQVAHKLNLLGMRTSRGSLFKSDSISRIVKNRVYLGEGRYNSKRLGKKAVAKDCHDPLMTVDEFEKIQALLKSRVSKENTKSLGIKSPINKLLVCGKCGGGLTIQKNNKVSKVNAADLSFYQVRPCIHRLPDYTKCDNGGIKVGKIEQEVYKVLKSYKEDLRKEVKKLLNSDVTDHCAKFKIKIENLEQSRQKMKIKQDKLLDLYLEDKLTKVQYENKAQDIEKALIELDEELTSARHTYSSLDSKTLAEKIESIVDMLENFEELPLEKQHSIMRLLIEKIIFTKPKGSLKPEEVSIDIHFREL